MITLGFDFIVVIEVDKQKKTQNDTDSCVL